MALLTAGALWQRLPGANPASLFLDDQWVAVLARDATLPQLAAIRPPVPAGFLLLTRALTPLAPGAAWPLQVVPLAAGLAVIPLAGWLVYRWTDSRLAGLAGALLLALNPTLGACSVRVKPFTLDALLTLALLALALRQQRQPDPRRLIGLAAAGAAAWLVSFPALLVSAVLVHWGAWMSWRRVPDRPRRNAAWIVVLVAAFDLALALVCWGWLRPARHAALVEYWQAGFLSFDSGVAAVRSVRFAVGGFLRGPFPDQTPWLAILPAVGLARALARPATRPLCVALLLIVLAAFLASGLRLYPVGQDRLDLYAYPVFGALAAAALTAAPRPWRPLPLLVVASLGILWGVDLARRFHGYPANTDRTAVRIVAAETRPEDALIVGPWTSYAVALYGPWPGRLVPDPRSTNGYRVELQRDRTLMLAEAEGGTSFLRRPEVLARQLPPLVATAPPRIVYVATAIASAAAHQGVIEVLRANGYQPGERYREANAAVLVFEARERRGNGAAANPR